MDNWDRKSSISKRKGMKSECEIKLNIADDDGHSPACHAKALSAHHQRNSNHLLKIFPEEIWILISKRLDDPNVFEVLINSSPPIRQILFSHRTMLLFGKVWNVLGMKLDKEAQGLEQQKIKHLVSINDNLDTAPNTGQKCVSCGMKRVSRPFSHILTLRLVCKEWCKAVDSFYNTVPHLFANENHPKKDICTLTHWLHNHFDTDNDTFLVQHFMPHFSKSHGQCPVKRSPFIGRSIYFEMGFCHMDIPDNVASLLVKYGHALRFCSATQCPPRGERESYLQMKKVLEQMPNLEFLRIYYIRILHKLNSIERFQLNEEIMRNQMPRLSSIQFLGTHNWPAPIFNEFIRANSHLNKLEILRTTDHEDYDIYSVALEKLTQLSISFYSEIDFLKFSGLRAPYPLTRLHINFYGVAMRWSQVFEVLEKNWGNTLINLVITLPQEPRPLRNPTCLKLYRLRTIKMTMDNYYSLEFLLGMTRTLESLDLHVQPMTDLPQVMNNVLRDKLATEIEKDGRLRFLSCLNDPLESNVWSLFPKMKRIRYCQKSIAIYTARNTGITMERPSERWSLNRLDWQVYRNKLKMCRS